MEFFGELFFAYNQGTDETHGIISEYSDGALGLALGYKYISSGGFTVDIYGGLGEICSARFAYNCSRAGEYWVSIVRPSLLFALIAKNEYPFPV